jgi:transposase-like protein
MACLIWSGAVGTGPTTDGPVEHPFVAIELNTSVQRRRQRISPGEVLLGGLLDCTLLLLAAGLLTGADVRLLLVLWLAALHLRIAPRARQQAYATCEGLKELRGMIAAINRLCAWGRLLAVLLMVVLSRPDTLITPLVVGGMRRIPQRTLSEGLLTSKRRDGCVDTYRVGTAHTETHWVIELRQPLTLRIPRDDPDFADVVMVVLALATGEDGRQFLSQADIGRPFRLSRGMTNQRVVRYKRRQRIEDVLSRQRSYHALTPPVVEAIHKMVFEDPFAGATQLRQRLVEQGVIARADDLAVATVTRAIRDIDCIELRRRLQELMGRGEIVADYRKLCQILLQEMKTLAEAAGTKLGQHLIPIAELIEPGGGKTPPQPRSSAPAPQRSAQQLPEPSQQPVPGILPAYRWSFFLYFSFGASYREVATFLGVHASTVYRRLDSLRRQLPPLQRLLGPLRYSGQVAIDEKYILASKPHREGKMGRWVYLFAAIDPQTYDLLHAQVYPAHNTDCARAFLLSLKAQGVLTPKVIVTDLWGPYETLIPEVYPGAIHHQCVFHAEQAATTLLRDKFGADFRSVPQAAALRQAIVHLFRAGCRRTLLRRYGKLLAQKETLSTGCAKLGPLFASLARHFEKLANAYSDRRLCIPHTNNAIERTFRTFTSRYKTMAGFERLETAQAFVQLWACYYRFRPFSPDANLRIRNRSPLQLAGYDLSEVRGLDFIQPPPELKAFA